MIRRQLVLPYDIEDATPPANPRRLIGPLLIAALLLLVLLIPQARAAVSVTADCPYYDLAKKDAIVVVIESAADGKPAVKSCRVIKRVPPGQRGEKRSKIKVNA